MTDDLTASARDLAQRIRLAMPVASFAYIDAHRLAFDILTREEATMDDPPIIHLDNPNEADAYLQAMNSAGDIPEVSGVDAMGRPTWLWLDEFAGDEVILRACVLVVDDGGATSTPIVTPPSDVDWPVTTVIL